MATIDIVRMTADGSFVSDKLYVTSDTTAIHSSRDMSISPTRVIR